MAAALSVDKRNALKSLKIAQKRVYANYLYKEIQALINTGLNVQLI